MKLTTKGRLWSIVANGRIVEKGSLLWTIAMDYLKVLDGVFPPRACWLPFVPTVLLPSVWVHWPLLRRLDAVRNPLLVCTRAFERWKRKLVLNSTTACGFGRRSSWMTQSPHSMGFEKDYQVSATGSCFDCKTSSTLHAMVIFSSSLLLSLQFELLLFSQTVRMVTFPTRQNARRPRISFFTMVYLVHSNVRLRSVCSRLWSHASDFLLLGHQLSLQMMWGKAVCWIEYRKTPCYTRMVLWHGQRFPKRWEKVFVLSRWAIVVKNFSEVET